ncbi:MAG: S9 family peptidase [Candidatus Aminicenantaceae bacterium]
MIRNRIVTLVSFILLIFLLVPFCQSYVQDEEKTVEMAVPSWLLLGPTATPLPAFHKEKPKGFGIEDLLKFESTDIAWLQPEKDHTVSMPDGSSIVWKPVQTEDGEILLSTSPTAPSTAYLCAYLDVKRWTAAVLSVKSPQVFMLFVDGKTASSKSEVNSVEAGETDSDDRKVSANLKLETGVHCLMIKTVFDPGSNTDWSLHTVLTIDEKYNAPNPELKLTPEPRMSVGLLLDGPKATGISVSPDGGLAALSVSRSLPPTDDSENWLELRSTEDGELIQTYRGGTSIASADWAPVGRKFAYVSHDKDQGTLWIVDLDKGRTWPLLENVKHLGSHVWTPDGQFIIFSVSEEGKKDLEGVKRFKNLADRQPGWRNRGYLYRINVRSGVQQRLTSGPLATALNSIHPDGKSLLFTREVIDYSERSFSKTELYTLNLESLKAEKIWTGSWFREAQWNPSGTKLLVLGGPSTFGAIGMNVPEGMIPNDYDTQAYLFDPDAEKVEPISKDFDPAINSAQWSKSQNSIYFVTTDRSFRNLYNYDLDKKTYTLIDTGVEVIGSFDMAENAPVAVYTGTSATVPPKAYAIELDTGNFRLLNDPGKNNFASVNFGDVKRWTFTNKKGVEIEGRVYYPPGFDTDRKYPCIVHYYGGTSPVDRSFGGRYPNNLYAAQGYVVYVLQPSGATGFGQAFSALHVNDWGKIVADEIITGTKKFLATHSFVDPERIGCIGASFGGFMTMLLQTKTDMFAAAIAHAGISSISSYWGEGYWGYSYSAVATAESYPWNRKDIYIDQSPLFAADKITTPLLLLHGSVDTNVPPGESTQLFTALKVLGREVEYIQVLDQNHHIMTYNKRILWTKTILAWFDRWLKHQPEWWNDLYPE